MITASCPFVDEFEELYIRLREKEGRIYSDEELAVLPFINKEHPKYKEWKIRERSCKKLSSYIKRKGNGLHMLEVGCGNGWLSARLAAITKEKVIGTDINGTELEQAKRVFRNHSNLDFINGDIRAGILDNKRFDIIVFAASVQYFSSFKEIINTALKYLKPCGEIHILDSHFYTPGSAAAAKQRTKDYYISMGFTALANYYHHHLMEELDAYRYTVLQKPNTGRIKLSAIKNPFHWINIKNNGL